jgi:putative RNA 2'-phosphotransferase
MTNLSKTIAYALRHSPATFGITLNEAGWVPVTELIAGLATQGHDVTFAEIEEIVATDNKQRYSLVSGQIRANQGHSIPVELGLETLVPPIILFHGTSSRFVSAILAEGIKSMSRHAVHLSEDITVATAVGARHGSPVILTVHAGKMSAQGIEFQRSANGVWLVPFVPSEFIIQ